MYTMKTLKNLLLAGIIGISGVLAGCGGGGAGGDSSTGGSTGGGTGGVVTPTATITGTAATGAPLPVGTILTIKDANNRTVSATGNTVGANGVFTLTISNPTEYTPPFIIQADPSASVTGDEHYSVMVDALADSGSYRVNITPVTSLILYEVTKKSLATVFSAPQTYLPGLTTEQLEQASSNVVAQFPPLQSVANQDFIGQTFSANPTNQYDAAMDAIGVVKIEFSGDQPTLKNENNVPVTYVADKPLYPIKSLTLQAGVPQQVANGASDNLLTATVLNTQDQPAKGVTVNFSTSAGTLYRFDKTAAATSAVTDDTGVAKLYLRAGTLTAATVTLSAETGDSAASGTTTVTFIPGVSAVVGLSASPNTLAPTNTTILTASVLDANNNKVADGETITFKRVTGASEVTIGTQPTSNGFAVLNYSVGPDAGTETIKAYSSNGFNAQTMLTVTPAVNAITALTLSSASSSMVANGVSTTTLTATARDQFGNGVPGAVVAFSTSSGSLYAVTSTNSNGVATATLTAGTNVMTARISASVNGITSTTDINFTASAAATVSINAAPNAVRPGNNSIITIAVVDGKGNAVANEPVTLTFDARGSGTPSLSAVSGTTNINGLLLVNYTAGVNTGSDIIRARTSNGFEWTTTISVAPANIVIGSVTTTASNVSIPVTTGTAVIRATVRDSANAPVSGATVNFTSTAGTLSGPTATDANGVAQVTLTAGPQVLTARIEATISGFTGATNVNFTAGAPNTVTVSAAPNAVNPGNSSTISAYVVDAGQNPVVGETVTFSIPTKGSGLPTLAVATAVTNVNGLAVVTYTAGVGTGNDTVSALTSNGRTGSTSINVSAANVVVGTVTVTANNDSIPVTGSTGIRAIVRDTTGQLVPGATVTFSSSAGTVNPTMATADANGLAVATLTAGIDILSATITASSGGISGNAQVSFTPGAATTVSVIAAPNAVKRSGTTTVTIAVVDGSGNPVANEPVNLSIPTKASGSPTLNVTSGTTNANGLLVVSYSAGANDGTDIIRAVASTGAFGTANIGVNASNAVVSTVSLAIGNGSIPVSSGSTSLNATVRDNLNQPLPGIVVTFSTTGGTITPATTATTNADGIATVTLTAGANVQTANVSATASNVSASGSVNFTAGAAATVGINAAPNAVKPGNNSIITIAVVDGNGNAVADEPVTLTFDQRGSGTPSLSEVSDTTDINGLLLVTYTAGANGGTDIIRARTSNNQTATATINVNQSNIVIGDIVVTSGNTRIPVTSGKTSILARVTDIAGQPVVNATVAFTRTAGMLSAATAVTDASGIATVELTAGNQVLEATVEASINGVNRSTTVDFHAGAATAVLLNAAPTTVRPLGTSNLYAYVSDASGNPVEGETVTFGFQTPAGSGQPGLNMISAQTNQNGMATVVYTAGAVAGTDTVTVTTGNTGVTNSLPITVSGTAIVVSSIQLETGDPSAPTGILIANGVSSLALRATVLDLNGDPAAGIAVNFATTAGTLSALTATTDANGVAEVTLTSTVHTQRVLVSANASGFVDVETVNFVAGAPVLAKFGILLSPAAVGTGGNSTIYAVVLDANDNPIAGETVTFTVTTNASSGGFPVSSSVTAVTNQDGVASRVYTAGNAAGSDIIRAALAGGIERSATLTVNAGTQANALSIGTSRTTVKSDNSETAVITVTALSSQNVVVPGVTVAFSADGGQLSAAQVVTNASGQAQVSFSPGTLDKRNRTVTITASASGVSDVLIPVQVVGSSVTLTTTSSTLTTGGASATITVTAQDASGLGIYNTTVTLDQSGTGSLTITPLTGVTDVNGQFTATVTGLTDGSRTVTAEALGASASQNFTVLAGGTGFGITAPAVDPVSMVTAGNLVFTVNAPTQASVRFATTIGTWSVCPGGSAGSNVCTATVGVGSPAGSATATLTSTTAGIAAVQVDGLDGSGNVTGTDNHTVAISAAVAARVTLQASAANVQPSTGGAVNTVTLIATLRDVSGQPVGGVPVAFSLENTTGGGESLSPVIKLSSDGVASTDPLGQARTTFRSGSLPSGQTSSSVVIRASVIGTAVTDTVNLVIGGSAGSVVIGQASHFNDNAEKTAYILPMAVQVSDSNGNPVPQGTVVSLSVWPVAYSQGVWVSATGDGTNCSPSYSGGSPIDNEDVNENLILDAGEDSNTDGSLTPGNSVAGSLPATVVTNANGLVNFNFNFLKQYAAWVDVRVRATALVQGSESTGNLVFTLPWLQVDSKACVLPHSPFN